MTDTRTSRWCLRLLAVLAAGLILCLVLLCLVPPVSRDALTHHLLIPRLYLQLGILEEIPWIKFSYYPQLMQLLYLPAVALGLDSVPKLMHLVFGLGTGALLFHFLLKRSSSTLAAFGTLLFLSTPIVLRLSISAYVDLGLVFFSFAALYALCKWIETACQTRWLLLAGLCCGLALSTKYNGLITLFTLTCMVPLLFIRHGPRASRQQLKGLGFAALFLAVSLSVFSPWMARNIHWKGNPIYPLFNGLLNPGASQAECAQKPGSPFWECQPKLSHFQKRRLLYDEAWWKTALIPLRVFFQGQDHSARLFDGRLNPLLLLLPLAAFAVPQRGAGGKRAEGFEKGFLLLFSLLFLLGVFLQRDMRVRYAAPMLPPLAVLSAYGLSRILSWLPRRQSNGLATGGPWHFRPKPSAMLAGLALCLAAVLLCGNFLYLGEQLRRVQPLSYLSGQMDREEYILKFRPELSVYRYANEHLPKNARLLGFFLGNRRYYLHRRTYCNTPYFQQLVQSSRSAQAMAAALNRDGISHILLSFRLFQAWTQDTLTPREQALVQSFFRHHADKLFARNGFGLYALKGVRQTDSRS